MVWNADPLAGQQWHLARIGIDRVFAEYRGAGVAVGVYDDGVDALHADLAGNYDHSLDITLNGQRLAPGAGTHGTAVAGIIAGVAGNGSGGIGIASEARLAGVDIFSGAAAENLIAALAEMKTFDVANHSWGFNERYSRGVADAAFGRAFDETLSGVVADGRGGLGTVIVNAAGNDWARDRRDANSSAFDASRYSVTVGAVGEDGLVANYSTRGASVLVSAPSSGGGRGLLTTDVSGATGYSYGDSTDRFGGTSGAAPVVTGVVALMLQANPSLGWRDVQDILAYSAAQVGSADGEALRGTEAFAKTLNGATGANGGGLVFSNDTGFGLVDAHAAVRMAEVWSEFAAPQTSANEKRLSASVSVGQTIRDGAPVSASFVIGESIVVEHVDLKLTLSHADMRDLQIALVSASGTESILLTPAGGAAVGASDLTWSFGAETFRGELSAGEWKIVVTDTVAGSTGHLARAAIDLFGKAATADDAYHYNDDFAALVARDGARAALVDLDGGFDWIDASAVSGDLVLDLAAGASSTLDGASFVRIDPRSVIEGAVGGDGDDAIAGNAAANKLIGGRGDDTLSGGIGADTLDGGQGVDTVSYADAVDGVRVDLAAGRGGDGDILLRIENVVGSAHADRIAGDAGANRLFGGAGDDFLSGGAGADTLDGGTGWDVADYRGSATAVHVDLAAGTGSHGDAEGDALAGIEGMLGSSFDDVLAGDDGLNALIGGAGDDSIHGRGGNDTLLGGAGADTIEGGAGDDFLFGGEGADSFRFSAGGFGHDRIEDFGAGDRIDLTGLGIAIDDFDIVAGPQGTVLSCDAGSITLLGVTALAPTQDWLFV